MSMVPAPARLLAYAHRIILDLAGKGVEPAEIARQPNEEGLLTLQRRPWCKETVRSFVGRERKKVSGGKRCGTAA